MRPCPSPSPGTRWHAHLPDKDLVMPLSIRKLTGRTGAVVEGVDLTAPPIDSALTALRDALNEHKALAFDHARLDDSGHERVAGWFGELTTAHPNVAAADGTTNVLAVDSETSMADEQLVGDASYYTGVLAVAA